MPGSLIHHLPPLVAGKDDGEHLVLPMEEASRLSTPPFSSQICCSSSHTAPVTLPPALCPYTADGTRLTASSGSNQELLDCSSLHHSSLWGRKGPSSTQHVPWHIPTKSFCRNTLVQLETQHLVSTRDLLSHWQGWKEDAPSAKGTPGWTRAPCAFSCDQLHRASLHPGLEREGPLSPPAATGQFKSALLFHVKNFLIPCGAPHSSMALNTALQPGCHRSPSQSTP